MWGVLTRDTLMVEPVNLLSCNLVACMKRFERPTVVDHKPGPPGEKVLFLFHPSLSTYKHANLSNISEVTVVANYQLSVSETGTPWSVVRVYPFLGTLEGST